MRFNLPDRNYWDNKFAAYMHDPIDKIFQIPGHEERAADLLEIFGLQKPNEKFWKKADGIASGFERGQVPSYSKNPNKNGAIDFLRTPIITHPTSENGLLKIGISGDQSDNRAKKIHLDLLNFIKEKIGMKAGEGGYSDSFKSDPDNFAYARFLYTHLALRFKLAENDVANLGALWHRIPADTRFPDHTIWQHNALTSALYSCMDLAKDESQVGMMIVSITPVQPFISKARRLRDYWTGSLLLSWLAFEGIRWIMENLGPDHILYPSLIDQPLINEYLATKLKVNNVLSFSQRHDIASLPNKILFLIPFNDAEAIGEDIKVQIKTAWQELYDLVEQQLSGIFGDENGYISDLFRRQNKNFWNIQWTAVRLLKENDKHEIEKLLPETKYENQFDVLNLFQELVRLKWNYKMDGRGILYSVSHSLVQSALAGQKIKNVVKREPENGEKCHLCGEFEVVHEIKHSNNQPASGYKKNIRQFWEKLNTEWKHDLEFKKNERLCSICLIKRIVYKALENENDHILNKSFKGAERFPSTTEMALHNLFKRENVTDGTKKIQIAQKIHNEADEKTENRDRYFAILLMDGDHMGKLVSGETLASTWKSIMHPEIVSRLENPDFDTMYHNKWKSIFENHPKRLLTPSIHAAISESLGDFSIYGAAAIVERYNGKLIYAGGDDVCAVLPVDTVLEAAEKIQKYYTSEFNLVDGNKSKPIEDKWALKKGKLSLNLGKGKDISISAGILICHHKESLAQMIAETHNLLDKKAKDEAGRNACAIELRKRSGGSRYFIRKWNSCAWESFKQVGTMISNKEKQQVSTSLVYRLEKFRPGINAILNDKKNYVHLMIKFIKKQLERSSITIKDKNKDEFAKRIVDIVTVKSKDNELAYEPEGLIVAGFLADKGGE